MDRSKETFHQWFLPRLDLVASYVNLDTVASVRQNRQGVGLSGGWVRRTWRAGRSSW